ncbi:MAG TPA: hypothetical protein VGV87_07470 [Blastocatellia bacterium]|nr:hypothetical protein [Blastocatellia bacterium]
MYRKVSSPVSVLIILISLGAAPASPASNCAATRAGAAGNSEAAPGASRSAEVVVMVNRVRRIDVMDPAPDPGADFYARVTIGGVEKTSTVRESRNDVAPQWTFTREVSTPTVPIVIKLFDKDDSGTDDHCDINPLAKERDLHINYDLLAGRITGDAGGVRQKLIHVVGSGDDKRAEIWFTVFHR